MTTNDPRRPRVLVSAASRHESTSEIARVIGGTLADQGIDVDIVPPEAVDSITDYDAVVLGSAVYNGHWLTPATDLATRFQNELAARSLWLFSSGPVGARAGNKAPLARQDPAEIARISQATQPRDHRIFAGRLDPQRLSRAQRATFVMFRRPGGDFRDWDEIGEWADAIAAGLTAVSPLPQVLLDGRGDQGRDFIRRCPGQRLDVKHVAEHGDADELSGYQGCPELSVRVTGELDDHGQQLHCQEPAERVGGLFMRHRRADEGEDGVTTVVAIDKADIAADQCPAEVLRRHRRQARDERGQAGRQAGGRREERLLGAEIVDHQGRVDVRLRRYGAN